MTLFIPDSLEMWLEKKELSFQQAVAHLVTDPQEETTLSGNLQQALQDILKACDDETARKNLLSCPLRQGELLSLLAAVPLKVRLRFLDLLAQKSLPLMSALMDERVSRGEYQKAALYHYESLKKVYALKVFFDLFAPENLSRMLILLERKKDGA